MKREVMELWRVCFDDTEEFIQFYFDKKYKEENALVYWDEQGAAIATLQTPIYPMAFGGMFADKIGHTLYGTTREGLIEFQKAHKDINNRVIANAPKDMIINTHVCRGNFHSTYASEGAYDSVADVLFGEENVNAYFLEFDDERSGGFAPLAKVSGDKKVVLGLITTKSPKLEDKQLVIDRIHDAAKYIPLDRLYLSPQCGFASCEIGNKLTEEEQWAKLKLVKEIATEVWG